MTNLFKKNPKSEILNLKQYQNSKFQFSKQPVWNLEFGKLGFISNFVLRISNLFYLNNRGGLPKGVR